MMSPSRRVALPALFAVCLACNDASRPTAPSPPVVTPPPPPVAVIPFPPLTGASTTYRFDAPLENFGSAQVREFTQRSSFVLYETGGFYLQYETADRPMRGRYQRDDRRVAFHFSEQDRPPDAMGNLTGNLLEVRFSDIMQHSDFENAAYRRVE